MIFAIVHFNTPELTTCLCSSVIKNHNDAKIVIFDNSDKRPFINSKFFNAKYIDNTKGQIINFENELAKYPNKNVEEQKMSGCNFGSAKHSMSIDWLCKNLNENFILLDSDVLLKKPIDFIDDTVLCCSDISHIHDKLYRMLPMIAYINVRLMKKLDISFFDSTRMHSLNKGKETDWYDTGASFYEDCVNNNSHKRIHYLDYIVHYGNGSWRQDNKAPVFDGCKTGVYEKITAKDWLIKFKDLWK